MLTRLDEIFSTSSMTSLDSYKDVLFAIISFQAFSGRNKEQYTKEEKKKAIINTIPADFLLQEQPKLDNIELVTFQGKTAISEEMMESSEVFENIMQNWTEEENPLQDTYLIKVVDINSISKTAEKIDTIENVELVKYGAGMVEQLISVFDMIRKIGIVTVAALIVVTAFLITNTIKITIFSRRREIEIMRLVGASNLNIKIPFILEGSLCLLIHKAAISNGTPPEKNWLNMLI